MKECLKWSTCAVRQILLLSCKKVVRLHNEYFRLQVNMTMEPQVLIEEKAPLVSDQQTNRPEEAPPTIVTVRMVVDGKVQLFFV